MELIDEPGALLDDGLQAQGDVTKAQAFGGDDGHGAGPFAEGEAGAGAGLDGVGLLGSEDALAIVLVALRVAAGDGEGGAVEAEPLQPGEEVVGIGTGDVESDVEVDAAVPGGELLEALAELGIAGGGLGELEFGRGLLQLLVEEGGVVAVACGIDADADEGDGRIKNGRCDGRRLARGCGSW